MKAKVSRTRNIAVAIMGVVILGFCAYGFGSKFVEFVYLVTSDDPAAKEGRFAVAPVMNYLFASLGFLCLMGWAAIQGMFRNIEQPGQDMLDMDAEIDKDNEDSRFTRSVVG